MSGFPRSGLPLVDGVLQMTVLSGALPAAAIKEIGWAQIGAQMYKIDSSATVPATAILHSGIAYSPDGGMYTTTAAPTASSTIKFGTAIRADGAMHIDKTVSGTTTLGQKRNANGVWITT